MTELKKYTEKLVFGLDIGTRSIVGTVGYLDQDRFVVLAQRVKEHETRAMLDGQIHDIKKVGTAIEHVKKELEETLSLELKNVCIAAAGRVLRTITTSVEQEFLKERTVTEEDVYALASLGIEKAYEEFLKTNDTDMKFYCVGYSVVHYYMNHYQISNLEGHTARIIGADLIATFLPDDVVDGLYKAVKYAGLQVANLTLEPIAAIQVAIPEMYRMLNMALVDVGAGTSDISITRDGTIVAFGMIPTAGDSLTEMIAMHCLVDFRTAETIKKSAGEMESIVYKDIMGIEQTITSEEILRVVEPAITNMTKQVSDKIKELNGGKPVSAVFVVGGGGKIPTYTDRLAEELGIQVQRVAVRGEEVMQKIEFCEEDVKKDSLLVTPIGICLNYYEQSNNFIFVTFNEERIKLYDNNRLAVVDAAMQAGFPNDRLFPKRGKEITYSVNGMVRLIRGEIGEAAQILVNGKEADIHTKIFANDYIQVKESTAGAAASMELQQIPEFSMKLSVLVNEKRVDLPAFASVNGSLQSGFYDIADGDEIVMLNFYTVEQVIEFMDVILEPGMNIYVNNKVADRETKVYENFSVLWTMEELNFSEVIEEVKEAAQNGFYEEEKDGYGAEDEYLEDKYVEENDGSDDGGTGEYVDVAKESHAFQAGQEGSGDAKPAEEEEWTALTLLVNQAPITLKGKKEYIFVDIFDYINMDLSKPQGSSIVAQINGRTAHYMEPVHAGDVIEVYWRQ